MAFPLLLIRALTVQYSLPDVLRLQLPISSGPYYQGMLGFVIQQHLGRSTLLTPVPDIYCLLHSPCRARERRDGGIATS